MSSAPQPPDESWPEDPLPVRWRSWPLRDNLLCGSMVVATLMGAGAAVHGITSKVHLGLLVTAVLAVALWRFLLPVVFELDTEGVGQKVLGRRRRIRWSVIRRWELCPDGVLLLPFSDRCPADAFRGLFLPWGGHRDQILAQVRYYLDEPLNP